MALVEAAYAWSHAHLSAALQDFAAEAKERFIADTGHSTEEIVYRALLRDRVLPNIAQALFGGESDVWYVGQQIFFKEGEKRHAPNAMAPGHILP